MTKEPFVKAWSTLRTALLRSEPAPGQQVSMTLAPGMTFAGRIECVDNLGRGGDDEAAPRTMAGHTLPDTGRMTRGSDPAPAWPAPHRHAWQTVGKQPCNLLQNVSPLGPAPGPPHGYG